MNIDPLAIGRIIGWSLMGTALVLTIFIIWETSL